MNTINEYSHALQLLAANSIAQTTLCDCCGKITALETMTCSLLKQDDQWVIVWVCPDCLPNTRATNGSNINRGVPVPLSQIEETLLAAGEWLDTELLKRNKYQPFIRRSTYAEVQRVAKGGTVIPDRAAVVVMKLGENRLRRRLLPMQYPWKGDWEWMAGADAAREALAVADAILLRDSVVLSGGVR